MYKKPLKPNNYILPCIVLGCLSLGKYAKWNFVKLCHFLHKIWQNDSVEHIGVFVLSATKEYILYEINMENDIPISFYQCLSEYLYGW